MTTRQTFCLSDLWWVNAFLGASQARGTKPSKGSRDCLRKWMDTWAPVAFALFCHVSRWSWALRWPGWHRATGTRLVYEIGRCLHVPPRVLMGLRIHSLCIRMVLCTPSHFPSPCWWYWYGVHSPKTPSTASLGSVDKRDSKLGFTPARGATLSMELL